jgi:subtilisin family serine protease
LRQRHFGIRLLTTTVAAVAALAFAGTAAAERYLVVYDDANVPARAGKAVARAGGTIVYRYGALGVVIAESPDPAFEANLQASDPALQVVRSDNSGSDNGGVESGAGAEAEGPPPGDLPNEPAAGQDTFEPLQWNMRMIRAREAQAITGGSPAVTVGVIDTGIDFTHPDLDGNFDAANSVSCVGGVPNQAAAAYDDDSGHGTHVAGVIAAESNGIGVVGVAPNVRIAAIKASVRIGTRDIFRPEAVVCALVWAADHGMDVANNSYSVDQELITDPNDLFCHSVPDDQVVIRAVQRAARYALQNGVTLVAAAGNQGLDLSHPPEPFENECMKVPAEIPGFITVSSVGRAGTKSVTPPISNYGVGVIDLAAPGGDPAQAPPPPQNLILSTWPGKASLFSPTTFCDPIEVPCPVPGASPGTSYYRYGAGTTQAAAHVSGVAALVISRFGDLRNPKNGKVRPGRVAALLQQTANPVPCPPIPTCQGGEAYNGWHGHGIVDALRAVTHQPSS